MAAPDTGRASAAPAPRRERHAVGRGSRSTTRRRCCRSSIAGSPRCSTPCPARPRSSTSTTAAATAAWRCSRHSIARDARVAVIDLSRNFGKEVAMTAGLDHAGGRRRRRDRRRPAGSAGAHPGDGACLGRRLRRRADAPPDPRAGKLAQEGDRARVLPRDRPHGHDRHPRERRRFPAAVARARSPRCAGFRSAAGS